MVQYAKIRNFKMLGLVACIAKNVYSYKEVYICHFFDDAPKNIAFYIGNMKIRILIGLLLLFINVNVGVASSAFLNQGEKTSSLIVGEGIHQIDLAKVKLINYYPSNNAWAYMWSRWDIKKIRNDFKRMSYYGFNTVRIIVHPSVFGYPTPKKEMIYRLLKVVNTANDNGLKVQLTFFDLFSDYADINGSKKWLKKIILNFTNNNVSFIELQNEMKFTDSNQIAWATQLVDYIRNLTKIPLTISVIASNDTKSLLALVNVFKSKPLDFYTIHTGGCCFYAIWKEALEIVKPMPLFIGEVPFSTYIPSRNSSVSNHSIYTEAYQEQYFRAVFYASKSLGLPNPAPWVFSDFELGAIPPSISAGRRKKEYFFGIFRKDNTEKPVASMIRGYYLSGFIDMEFNNGFEEGGDLPLNWRSYLTRLGDFARDTQVFHSGSASARLSNTTESAFGVPSFVTAPVKFIEPNRRYSLKAWGKGYDLTGINNIALAWFDKNSTYILSNSSPPLPRGNSDWMLLELKAVAPTNAAYVQIHLKSQNNNGIVWYDDVTFD